MSKLVGIDLYSTLSHDYTERIPSVGQVTLKPGWNKVPLVVAAVMLDDDRWNSGNPFNTKGPDIPAPPKTSRKKSETVAPAVATEEDEPEEE